MDGMKFKGTVVAFADYVQYSPTLWYRGFYKTVYSRAISTNRRRHFLNLTTTVSQDSDILLGVPGDKSLFRLGVDPFSGFLPLCCEDSYK